VGIFENTTSQVHKLVRDQVTQCKEEILRSARELGVKCKARIKVCFAAQRLGQFVFSQGNSSSSWLAVLGAAPICSTLFKGNLPTKLQQDILSHSWLLKMRP